MTNQSLEKRGETTILGEDEESQELLKIKVFSGSVNLNTTIQTTCSSHSAIEKGTTVSYTIIEYMEELVHHFETID